MNWWSSISSIINWQTIYAELFFAIKSTVQVICAIQEMYSILSTIDEYQYFLQQIQSDLGTIIKDIKQNHVGEKETAPKTSLIESFKDSLEYASEIKGTAIDKEFLVLCKNCGVNPNKVTDLEKSYVISFMKKSKKFNPRVHYPPYTFSLKNQVAYDILNKERAPTPKWMLPKKVYMVIRPRLFCWQTGEAFLFLLTISLIKKVQKRYNQTTKGTEQSQHTDEYRNNFESCHNNAPPFLCIPASRLVGSGGYHPVMGTLPTCFHARILYHFM